MSLKSLFEIIVKKQKAEFKGDCGKPKWTVSSGSNMIAYLQTKPNMYAELKTEEIRRRQVELDERKPNVSIWSHNKKL